MSTCSNLVVLFRPEPVLLLCIDPSGEPHIWPIAEKQGTQLTPESLDDLRANSLKVLGSIVDGDLEKIPVPDDLDAKVGTHLKWAIQWDAYRTVRTLEVVFFSNLGESIEDKATTELLLRSFIEQEEVLFCLMVGDECYDRLSFVEEQDVWADMRMALCERYGTDRFEAMYGFYKARRNRELVEDGLDVYPSFAKWSQRV